MSRHLLQSLYLLAFGIFGAPPRQSIKKDLCIFLRFLFWIQIFETVLATFFRL